MPDDPKRGASRRGKGSDAISIKFRTRWRHVLLIDDAIRHGEPPNCTDLARKLEVCRRTVMRDIDFLRYDLGAPVAWDAMKRGYVYTEPNWVMPSVRITEGELFALMVAQKALDSFAGTPWAEKLRRVFDRMTAALPSRIEIAPSQLLDRVDFDLGGESIIDPDVLASVSTAVTANETLKIEYAPLGQEKARDYTVDPYVLRRARGAWYIAARDHRSGYIPLFNLSRIRNVERTGNTFNYESSGFDPRKDFAHTFSAFEGTGSVKVVVEFSGAAAQFVRERHWHPSQKLTPLKDGKLRFEAEISHLDDLWPWLLSWGAGAKVVYPKELAQRHREEAAAMAALYRK